MQVNNNDQEKYSVPKLKIRYVSEIEQATQLQISARYGKENARLRKNK